MTCNWLIVYNVYDGYVFSGFLVDSLSHSEVAVAQEVIYSLEGGWFDSWPSLHATVTLVKVENLELRSNASVEVWMLNKKKALK